MNDDDAPTPVDSARSHKWSSDSEPQAMNDGSSLGFWATAGFASIVFVVFYLIILVVGILFMVPIMDEVKGLNEGQIEKLVEQLRLSSSIGIIAAGILCPALIVLITRLRRGITVPDYLALRRPPHYRSLLGWLALAVGLVAISDGLAFLLGRDMVPEFKPAVYSQNFDPEFISELFSTSKNPPLFWFAFILMTPLFHEFLFRGFLFGGWSLSKLGVTGTILLTSILWALIHLSYGFYHFATLFVFGIFLGLARHRTRSLIVPIAIHCLMNLITSIQALYMFQR